ncbi:MAG TPA: MFS transporter [Pyrinomonadaceae bacterium]|nr:MFS transporter [Pyrinomonadaceae bacterium]
MSSTATTRAEAARPDGPSQGLAVLCACLLMLAALVDSQVVGAIAPQVAAGVGASKAAVAASVTAYSVAAACVALLLARGALGGRPATWLPFAAVTFVAGACAAAAAPHVAVFWAGRAVAGLAGGLVSALVVAALADASSYARRGRQMSGVAVCYFLAPVVGVPLAAWLAGRAGWRTVFVAVAVLTALAGLLVKLFPLVSSSRDEDPTRRAVDASELSVKDAARSVNSGEGARAKVSLWRLMMRTRTTRRGVVSAFFVSGGLVALTTYLGAWLSDSFNASAGDVGATYAVAGAGAVVGGFAGGALADRVGKRRVAAASSLWLALFVLLLPTFTWGARLWAALCVTAFLAALRVAPLQALVTEVVEPAERATYVALRNASSQLGIAAAVAAGGRLYQGWGLFGVGLLSAGLTLCAWLSVRRMEDPHAARAADEGEGEPAASAGVTGSDRKSASNVAETAERGGGRRAGVVRKLIVAAVSVILVVFLLLPWLLSFAITKAGTRPDERARTDTPAEHGATFEDVAFTSEDGVRLSGWYLPSRGRGVSVVLTHGLFRSRYEMLERGVRLWREGYGVMLHDLRRHGRSAGAYGSVGYFERLDVLAAMRYARGREPGNRVVLFGLSMGASATLLAAAEAEARGEAPLAVVAESGFLSFADTARHHVSLTPIPTFPFAALLVQFTAWRLGFDAKEFDVLRAVGRLNLPVLFVGAGADNRMPTATVLEPLARAARHPLSRKFVVEGARHGRAYDAAPDEYMNAVLEFLDQAEREAGDAARR